MKKVPLLLFGIAIVVFTSITPLLKVSSEDAPEKTEELQSQFVEAFSVESLPTPKPINKEIFNAARNGDDKLIEKLVRRGVDVNQMDEHRATPLHFAVANDLGKPKAVLALLKSGADINARDILGSTPLFHAMHSKNGDDYARLLIEHGAEVNAARNDKRTPLHIAAGWTNRDIFELLLERGADLNALDRNENSPFMLIVRNAWEVDIVRLCIQKGANVHLLNKQGKSALMLAEEEFAKERLYEPATKRLLEIIEELKKHS